MRNSTKMQLFLSLPLKAEKFLQVMRVVIQRVKRATVATSSGWVSHIGQGMLVLAGIEHSDTSSDVEWLSGKINALRIFDDNNGVMNLNVNEINGQIMVISQFTLHARTAKGNRPSYMDAAAPEVALQIYRNFKLQLELLTGKPVATGKFGEQMEIELVNDGPVTIIIDSKNRK